MNHTEAHSENTPLLFAIEAKGDNVDVVMKLIDNKADPNKRNLEGWTPLLKAVSKNKRDTALGLLRKGSHVGDVFNKTADSALHLACGLGDFELVRELLAAGADQQALNKEKLAPADVARRKIGSNSAYQ